ncbi:MAG: DUF1552 domain-containing protein [Myxococcota bacterium]
MTLTRRSFLKALGAGAATLPFLSLLERSVFGAEATGTAKRFIGLYHPHGASSPLFLGPDATSSTMELRYRDSVLAPFDDPATYGRSFKDVIAPIHGLDVIAEGGHDAPQALLTASSGANASIDQFLAVEKGLGSATPVTSVVLAVGNSNSEKSKCISFAPGGVVLPKIINPRQTFDLLFANLVVGDDPDGQAKLAQARLRGQSVLDFVRGDIKRLEPRLAAPEKLKLDQHLTSLREIEKRLESAGGAVGPMCVKPSQPREIDKVRWYNGGEPNFEEITNLQVDLLAQAMTCDVTRFGTIMFNDLSRGGAAPAGLAGLPDDNHGDLAHRYDGPWGPHYGNGGEGDRASWRELGKLNRWHYGKCARLLQRLEEGGILEETLVLMTSDMGDPAAHSSRNIPVVLAGGAGGALRMGRRVLLQDDCPPDRYFCDEKMLVPNNRLLVSVARAFGVEIDRFGGGDDAVGALSALQA